MTMNTALYLFHAALHAGTQMDIHRLRAECMVGIGEIMLRRGDLIQAKRMWAVAHPLFVRSSRRKDAASIEKRLEKLSQQDNSDSLAIREGRVDEATESVSVVKLSDGDTAAAETSLEKLENLSAQTTYPSPQLEAKLSAG
jgi:hypothetical protein